MVLAIDGTTPAKVTGTTAAITSAAFSPPAGSVLWAFVARNGPSAGNDDGTVSSTGGLSWSLAGRKSTNAGSTNGAGTEACVEIWRAYAATAPGSITVTDTRADGAGGTDRQHILKVLVITGAEPVWAGAITGTSSASGLPSASVTTTRASSWVFAVASDWAQAGLGTAGASQTIIDEDDVAGQYSAHIWRQDATTPASGTSVTMNLTAPAAEQYNELAIEVREPADGWAPPVLPSHLLYELIAAKQQLIPDSPAAAAQVPDAPKSLVGPAFRTLRAASARRGRLWSVPPPVAAPPATPDFIQAPIAQARRPRPGVARRGEYQPTPVGSTTTVAPLLGRRRPPAQALRRRSQFLVPQAVAVPPATRRRARPSPAVRRGVLWFVPPVVVAAAGPGPLVTGLIRALPRRVPPIYRRGDIQIIPLVGAAPAAPTPAPSGYLEQTHTRPAPGRRGRFLSVPPAAGSAPPLLARRRPVAPVRRRGTFARVVVVVGQPPTPTVARRRPRPQVRRGQFLPLRLVGLDVPPPPSVFNATSTDTVAAQRGSAPVVAAGATSTATATGPSASTNTVTSRTTSTSSTSGPRTSTPNVSDG